MVNQIQVIHEWLLAYPQKRAQRWFEREYDPASQQEKWYFGNKFKGNRQILQKATRRNALFLSTAIQLNNDQLKPVFNWFQQKLTVIGLTSQLIPTLSIAQCQTEGGKQKMMAFLNAADLSIVDIQLKTQALDKKTIQHEPSKPYREQNEWDKVVPIHFFHTRHDTQEWVPLSLKNNESEGTQKLFALAGHWLDILEKGKILLVDELESSLHPLMVRFLMSLLHHPEMNKNNAQLILTTHETPILDSQLFRHDQIWFVEKNSENATQLYPLSDFIPRKLTVRSFFYQLIKNRYKILFINFNELSFLLRRFDKLIHKDYN